MVPESIRSARARSQFDSFISRFLRIEGICSASHPETILCVKRDEDRNKKKKKKGTLLTRFHIVGYFYPHVRSFPHWTGGVIEGRLTGIAAEGSIRLYDVRKALVTCVGQPIESCSLLHCSVFILAHSCRPYHMVVVERIQSPKRGVFFGVSQASSDTVLDTDTEKKYRALLTHSIVRVFSSVFLCSSFAKLKQVLW